MREKEALWLASHGSRTRLTHGPAGPGPSEPRWEPSGPGPTCALSAAHGGTNGPRPSPPFKSRPARPLGGRRRKGRGRTALGWVRCFGSRPVLRERGGAAPLGNGIGNRPVFGLGAATGSKERTRALKPSRSAGDVNGAPGAAPPFPARSVPPPGPAGRGLPAARAGPGPLRPPSAAGRVKWRRGEKGVSP